MTRPTTRWFLAAGAGAAAAALTEAGFRLLVHQEPLLYQDSSDPSLLFELRPGASGIKMGVPVEISPQGLRDRPVLPLKPANEFRILFVGDHCSFGLGVQAADTFVRRVESLVRVPRGKRARTINLSMYHYNLDQKIRLLSARGLALQPDVIVLQTAPDDGGALPRPSLRLPRLKNFLRARSEALRWANERLFWSRQRDGSAGAFGARPPEGAPSAERSAANAPTTFPAPASLSVVPAPGPAPEPTRLGRQVAEFGRLADIQGVPALLLHCPDLAASGSGSTWASAWGMEFRSASGKAGVPFHDLSAELLQRPAETLLLRRGEPHLNAEGHRAAAEAVAAALQRLLKLERKPRKVPLG